MRQSILLVSLLVAAFAAQAQTMKPGLWEIRQQPKLDPARQAQMEQAQAQMAKMSPDQRKMMEDMMAKRGVSMDFSGGGVITVKMCVSEEQAKRNEPPVATRGNCTHEVKRDGSMIHTRFACTNPASEGTSDVTLKPGGEGFTARTHITHTRDGKTEAVDATSDASWLGTDCGALKPINAGK
ncbi:DUF3617 domain-containing protein [Pelomonas sp. KK5]|uniref:DUF3617 domain-containing protein n=1 Tax=Pelomonas sp. KK5 TaxID=1855730 RepID=UPI00097BC2F1|nr:DUF3617 domain-containing protein [Pelomonas sp. KK5]